ncbi:MAG: glucuronate isomerase, partial [Defluviitaleaceae bacterium]|nr:glucuronate isomerase [Defluviitaleaceae bacterium]
RLLRHNGVPERHITGDAPDKEKFAAFCTAIEKCIGNPVYHWAHLELKEYFGYNGVITADKADALYEMCNAQINQSDFNVQNLLKRSHVEWLGTTDDPADTLEYHIKIKADNIPGVPKVLPSFRPSNALDLEKPGFASYMQKLGNMAGIAITDWESLTAALANRVGHFHEVGCRASDHSLEPPVFNAVATVLDAEAALKKALKGETLTHDEITAYKTHLMVFLGGQYAKRNWVMQIHMGAQRNNNTRMLHLVGADAGFDSMSDQPFSLALNRLLNAMEEKDQLPRTVLYALNPTADDMLAATIGNFAGRGIKGRMQWGSAWWFNDTKPGMIKHMVTLASMGILANFIGMLTDSRSFISYPRHEYFRRILANQLGEWVEAGEFPADMDLLRKIAADIAYNNVKEYFGEIE